MRCPKCGAALTEGTTFCSYCGVKIEGNTNAAPKDQTVESDGITNQDGTSKQQKNAYTSAATPQKELKSKLLGIWCNFDLFSKISIIALAVVMVLLIVSIGTKTGFAIFFSFLQITGVILALLMHKGIVKLNLQKNWIKYLVLTIAIAFTILNVMSYSWGKNNNDSSSILPETEEMSETSTAVTPYGSTECVKQNYSAVKSDFSLAGFKSVSVEKIEDLASTDSDKIGTVESVSINSETDFAKGQEYDAGADVLIRYHGYKKCTVTVHIDFVENLMLSKYDVNFLVDDVEEGTLSHGEDQDFELSLDPGEYTFVFESTESSSVKGETILNVDCDTEVAYKISCSSDEVSIEELYVDRQIELNEGEVKLDTSASDYEYKNYQEVESALNALGFANIKYNVLYDIYWGVTDEGEVDSVSIAGNTDFKRGDVFTSDSEIIITYHMNEEDDPANETESEAPTMDASDNESEQSESEKETDSESEEILTVDNCQELKDLLAVKDSLDSSIGDFASKYKGRIIEFDGRIDYCTKHENYDTRFDYLVSAGDYDPDHQIGPTFKFENVSYNDLNTNLDTVSVGLNVHIVAEVVSYNSNSGLFFLDPIEVTGR